LCFTSTVESTHRLALLLKLLLEATANSISVAEFSASLSPKERTSLMRDFKARKIKLMICSDVMSRGLDIEDVELVVNYDVPSYITTYIHRVGRTARAGREGTTYSIARFEEVHHFKQILSKVENSEQIPHKIDRKTCITPLLPKYKASLHKLEIMLATEQGSEMGKVLKLGNINVHTETKTDVDTMLRNLRQQAQERFFPQVRMDNGDKQ